MSRYHKRHKQQTKPIIMDTSAPAQPNSDPLPPSRRVSLTPLAPLIVRSGRPFDSQADPARLPPPSTLAGCLRTARARARNEAFGPELLDLAVTGPLLIRGDTLLLPKPADALYFLLDDEPVVVRATPQAFKTGCHADLPKGLMPVRLTQEVRGKPGPGPSWWSFKDWIGFREDDAQDPTHAALKQQGWTPPAGDHRTHVAINPETLAAADSQLYQTQGLDLSDTPEHPGVRLLAEFAEPLCESLVHLGGERRLAALTPYTGDWPSQPAGWAEAIYRDGGLSLTLITPGLFSAGYRPGWLDDDLCGAPPGCPGLRLRLCAVAVERWQPHSGWDLASQKPRATRKLMAAGAVYWFEVLDGGTPAALQTLWLNSLSDDPQDRRDGFGLALPAPWKPTCER